MVQENIAEEMGTIALLAKQLEAKDKRIKYLEMVLEQRIVLTEGSLNGRVAQSEDEALTLFRETPGVGFTYGQLPMAKADGLVNGGNNAKVE